jgi:hypothetical protein
MGDRMTDSDETIMALLDECLAYWRERIRSFLIRNEMYLLNGPLGVEEDFRELLKLVHVRELETN